MKALLLMLLFISSHQAFAKALKVNANQGIMDILIESAGQKISKLTPVTIEVKNILCTRVQNKVDCSANFNVNGTEELRRINKSDQFFRLLRSKNAIVVDEELLGSTNFRSQRLSCSFTTVDKNYYSCSSDVTVNF
jgi:hypothetical protein